MLKLTVFCLTLLASAAWAQSPVTVTVEARPDGYEIPGDFAGISAFTRTQVRDHRNVPGNLFSGTNTQLITLFKNAGLHHIRLGATGGVKTGQSNLSHEDIDALFAFAKATDTKVIYSLHAGGGVATAEYIWKNYRPWLDYFAYDNEPDARVERESKGQKKDDQDYFTEWRDFAASVKQALPEAKFAGPDAAGRSLVRQFVKKENDVSLVTQHCYVGGNPVKKKIDSAHAIEHMLSTNWVRDSYPVLYKSVLQPVAKKGLPFRITEFDDHTHGRENASETFCAALWALDAMHWWAAHGAAGVNFQNSEWKTTDTYYIDAATNYQIYPKAYGIKAFELGGHGRVQAVTIENTNHVNVTAYAVADATNLYVTIVNKEYGSGARDASVTVSPGGFATANAVSMLLTSNGNVAATNGITLGGGTITNNAPWHGEWTPLKQSNGQCVVTVPATSAVVVKMAGK